MQIISCPSTFVGVIRRRVFSLSTLHGDIGRLNLSNNIVSLLSYLCGCVHRLSYKNQVMPIIGYWIESLDDDRFLAPQEIAGKLSSDIIEQLVTYLRNGKLYAQYRGLSWCRFVHGCSEQNMGSSELTDGYWIWPEGLVHYVDMHRVLLPAEFLADVLNKSEINGKNIEPDPDLGFWIKWCRRNQDPDFRSQLMSARKMPQISAQDSHATLVREIEDLQHKYGLSEQLCLSEGCRERALQSQEVCVRHFLGDERWERGWRPKSNFHSLLYNFGSSTISDQAVPQKTIVENELPR